jgi:signal transduction histidine kinase
MKKSLTLFNRWMLTPGDIFGIVSLILITVSGLYFSIRDALQLEETIRLSLTQTVILNQGIVNLQREVQLTRNEVTRLLGKLDNPPQDITRFDFIKIQVNNLTTAVETPSIRFVYTEDDLALVEEIKARSDNVEQMLMELETVSTPEKEALLESIDAELKEMESVIKQLIDRQATTQRNAIIQTRDTLFVSQRTDLITGGALLLLGIALALVFRQTLSTDQIKSQLLRTVSHELRTPLAAISGYTQLLEEEAYGPITKEQKNSTQKILLNATQLQGMVNNLLDGAQIEQGKLFIKYIPFSAEELVRSTHAALEVLAKTKDLELTSEIAPDVPATLISDKLRLQQILFNLTSNALKFTETGKVHTKVFMPDSSHWALQVKDTGIGMSADSQEHIFDSFWQVDSSATRKYRGSGLGLSIVKQLVTLMNGKVNVHSELGKGSEFTVTFPLDPKQ